MEKPIGRGRVHGCGRSLGILNIGTRYAQELLISLGIFMKSNSLMLLFACLTLAACNGEKAGNKDESGPAAFNANALAGTFTGKLPCMDCEAIATSLLLKSDGTYQLDEKFVGRETNSELRSSGRWNTNTPHNQIILDPSSQDWADRPFQVVSSDEIVQLDGNGVPYTTDGSYSLTRSK